MVSKPSHPPTFFCLRNIWMIPKIKNTRVPVSYQKPPPGASLIHFDTLIPPCFFWFFFLDTLWSPQVFFMFFSLDTLWSPQVFLGVFFLDTLWSTQLLIDTLWYTLIPLIHFDPFDTLWSRVFFLYYFFVIHFFLFFTLILFDPHNPWYFWSHHLNFPQTSI